MSSILLSNPFTAPAPPPSAVTTNALVLTGLDPLQATKASTNTNDSAGFNGSSAGLSNQDQTVALMKMRENSKWGKPADATGGSVIGAQTGVPSEYLPFGANLPEVEMPDPLPTSPFLKRKDTAA